MIFSFFFQMAEIRQLLNIIEQLEKKLGLEAGHSMRLRLEKDSLHELLKKSSTYDAWDRMMSSTMKEEQGRTTPSAIPVSYSGASVCEMHHWKAPLVRKIGDPLSQENVVMMSLCKHPLSYSLLGRGKGISLSPAILDVLNTFHVPLEVTLTS